VKKINIFNLEKKDLVGHTSEEFPYLVQACINLMCRDHVREKRYLVDCQGVGEHLIGENLIDPSTCNKQSLHLAKKMRDSIRIRAIEWLETIAGLIGGA